MKKIVITNDDGIHSRGLEVLVNAVQGLGELSIFAPSEQRSGSGCSITIDNPLQLLHFPWENAKAWRVTGTPVDCVRLALHTFQAHPPDLVISGINAGSNPGRTLFASGTCGAAIEAALRGIPAIAFSSGHFEEHDFEGLEAFVRPLVRHLLERPFPSGTLFNVNFPGKVSEIRGMRCATQGVGRWLDEPSEVPTSHGEPLYWMGRQWKQPEEDETSEIDLLAKGYATVVPIDVSDLTHHDLFHEHREAIQNLPLHK